MGKTSKDRGRAAEQRIARKLGTERTPYSGAGTQKGDVVHPAYVVEVKVRGGKSLALQKDWLDKVAAEAAQAGKSPVLIFRFLGDTKDYAVLPLELVPGLMPDGGQDGS